MSANWFIVLLISQQMFEGDAVEIVNCTIIFGNDTQNRNCSVQQGVAYITLNRLGQVNGTLSITDEFGFYHNASVVLGMFTSTNNYH